MSDLVAPSFTPDEPSAAFDAFGEERRDGPARHDEPLATAGPMSPALRSIVSDVQWRLSDLLEHLTD